MAATFEVETGSGSANANSYVSVADATQIIENLETSANVTAWAGYTTAVQQAALRDATRFVDQKYGRRWLGTRGSSTQALDWPRFDAEDYDGFIISGTSIPEKLKTSVTLLAVLSAAGTSLWNTSVANSGRVEMKKVKAGPVERTVKYTGGNSPYRRFPRAEAELSDLIQSAGRISRA